MNRRLGSAWGLPEICWIPDMCHTSPSVADFELCGPENKSYPLLETLVSRLTSTRSQAGNLSSLPLTTWNPLSSYFHSFSLCSQWPWWPCGLWFCGFWPIWCIMLIDHNSSLIKLFFHDGWLISTIFHGYDYLWALVMLCGTNGDHQNKVIMIIISWWSHGDHDDHYDLWEIRVCP